MIAMRYREPTEERREALRKAVRYEWLTINFMGTIIGLMYFTLGSSQAMKTAWIEDILSLVAPIAFLISAPVTRRNPNKDYPYGYHRAASIAFLCGSVALFSFGMFLLYESLQVLVLQEHPMIGAVSLFGIDIWLGWLMIAVLLYSVVPPFILGRIKLKLAEQAHDKTLFADADMNRADWMTALAAILGVLGIARGWWWADAVAAGFISIEITRDGYRNLRTAVTDLMNRHPMTIDEKHKDPLPERLRALLEELPWVREAAVRLREEGHVFMGEAFVVPVDTADLIQNISDAAAAARDCDWRLHDLVIMPVNEISYDENAEEQ